MNDNEKKEILRAALICLTSAIIGLVLGFVIGMNIATFCRSSNNQYRNMPDSHAAPLSYSGYGINHKR